MDLLLPKIGIDSFHIMFLMFSAGTLFSCTIRKNLDWAGGWCWLTRWALLNVHPRVWRSHHPLLSVWSFTIYCIIWSFQRLVHDRMWYSHSVPCSLAQVSMRFFGNKSHCLTQLFLVYCALIRLNFQGPGQRCGTKGVSSHPMVDPPTVSIWLLLW